MRILIYGLNYSPELTGVGKYTGDMAVWLAERGHEVHVIAAPPYYPAWQVRADYRTKPYRIEAQAPGLTVYRTPLYVPAKPTGKTRVLHLFSFMIGSLPAVFRHLWWKPQIIFTVEPTFFCAPVALLYAQLLDIPSWLHIKDFEIDAAFDLAMLPPGGFINQIACAFEKVFTSRFSFVSALSDKMVARAIDQKAVPMEKTAMFPDWVDVEEIRPMKGPNAYRKELGLEGKTIVLYSGNMGKKQGMEVLGPLARSCSSDSSIHFLLCGDGPLRGEMERIAATSSNITLLPLQPYARFNELLNAADIHLLPQKGRVGDLVMPSKLLGMLASGRATVATAGRGTHVEEVLSGRMGCGPCGVVVEPDDEEALYAAVRGLAADPALRERMGSCARCYAVKELGRDHVLSTFEDSLYRVAGVARVADSSGKIGEDGFKRPKGAYSFEEGIDHRGYGPGWRVSGGVSAEEGL